ncbi:MAG: hypothetical protein M3A44_10690 [Gammaproteobacteria bacterium]
MAKVGDVNPLYPVWPTRPVEKVDPRKHPTDRPSDRSGRDRKMPDEKEKDEGHPPYIDDYA